jgi:hypothetical protein
VVRSASTACATNTTVCPCSLAKQRLAQSGTALFRLMAGPSARTAEGVMAIVRETLCISVAAAAPIRDAALQEGIIVRHLLTAMRPVNARANGALLPGISNCAHVAVRVCHPVVHAHPI